MHFFPELTQLPVFPIHLHITKHKISILGQVGQNPLSAPTIYTHQSQEKSPKLPKIRCFSLKYWLNYNIFKNHHIATLDSIQLEVLAKFGVNCATQLLKITISVPKRVILSKNRNFLPKLFISPDLGVGLSSTAIYDGLYLRYY